MSYLMFERAFRIKYMYRFMGLHFRLLELVDAIDRLAKEHGKPLLRKLVMFDEDECDETENPALCKRLHEIRKKAERMCSEIIEPTLRGEIDRIIYERTKLDVSEHLLRGAKKEEAYEIAAQWKPNFTNSQLFHTTMFYLRGALESCDALSYFLNSGIWISREELSHIEEKTAQNTSKKGGGGGAE